MSTAASPTFSKWRERLWPIHRFELRKLLPLIFIKFLISVNYGILTCMKDTLIVTSKGSGAEVIPVLKGWVVLPVAMVVAIIYSKLSNLLNKKRLFYTVLGGFLGLIFIYGFILYPFADVLSPHASADWLVAKLGSKSTHWVAVYRNWIQTLLFVTAEMWGSVVILVMFWGFANDVTTVSEAKRSYNIYIAAGDLAALSIGPIICYITRMLNPFSFTITVQALISLVLFIGFLIMGTYWWVNKYGLTDQNFHNAEEYMKSPKKKEKVSLRQGFRQLAKSRYLLGIAIIVVGYGLAINLVEVTWKASLKLQYPSPADYQAFMSKVTSCVGFFAFVTSMLFGGRIIRLFGWHVSAQLTPILVGATGILFLIFCTNQNLALPFASQFGISSLMFLVILGAIQNVTSKVAKYSFFDPTKEMAYIPLDEEAKVKGKAAIDVVGSRLGKSGSAWIQMGLIHTLSTGSILSVTHILVPIVSFTIISWILSVRSLSKRFHEKQDEQLVMQNG